MLRKGAPGVLRLLKNGARVASRRWERPARSQWWAAELEIAGFVEVRIEVLEGTWLCGRCDTDCA
ncbi:MAG: hypothetical protein H0W96_00210 [Solirubrobacterales bacterium]|nr:hypothetical protein [Solirubrobacterales bacterium]